MSDDEDDRPISLRAELSKERNALVQKILLAKAGPDAQPSQISPSRKSETILKNAVAIRSPSHAETILNRSESRTPSPERKHQRKHSFSDLAGALQPRKSDITLESVTSPNSTFRKGTDVKTLHQFVAKADQTVPKPGGPSPEQLGLPDSAKRLSPVKGQSRLGKSDMSLQSGGALPFDASKLQSAKPAKADSISTSVQSTQKVSGAPNSEAPKAEATKAKVLAPEQEPKVAQSASVKATMLIRRLSAGRPSMIVTNSHTSLPTHTRKGSYEAMNGVTPAIPKHARKSSHEALYGMAKLTSPNVGNVRKTARNVEEKEEDAPQTGKASSLASSIQKHKPGAGSTAQIGNGRATPQRRLLMRMYSSAAVDDPMSSGAKGMPRGLTDQEIKQRQEKEEASELASMLNRFSVLSSS